MKVQLRFTEFTIVYTMAKIMCVALLCYVLKTVKSMLLKPAIYSAYAYTVFGYDLLLPSWVMPGRDITRKFSILQIIIGFIVRHCATSRKVAGSIPNGVIRIFQ